MPVTNTDAVLWYNVGEFGKAGYAVPNWSNDVGSLNPQILDWTYLVGRNLFHIMHHEDADLRIPPSINTAKRIHKLYIRAAQHPGRPRRAAGREQHGSHPRPAGGRSVPRVSGAVLPGAQPVHAPLGRADSDLARRGDAAHGEPQEHGNLHRVRRPGRPVHQARVHQHGDRAVRQDARRGRRPTASRSPTPTSPPTTRATSSRKPKWSTRCRGSTACSPKIGSTCWPKESPSPSCPSCIPGRRISRCTTPPRGPTRR